MKQASLPDRNLGQHCGQHGIPVKYIISIGQIVLISLMEVRQQLPKQLPHTHIRFMDHVLHQILQIQL